MSKYFFVTGTDTDAGKTFIATALLEKARSEGLQTLGLKPLAAGGENYGSGLQNEDAVKLREHATIPLRYSDVNPVLLLEPMAPHIAAAREGKCLSVAQLENGFRDALQKLPAGVEPDLCLVEGAGGWRVPLNNSDTVADLAKALQLPVILVVGLKLGCLNHALLTAEAIAGDGLNMAAWVVTQTDPNMAVADENIETLAQLLPAPCLGYVPWLDPTSVTQAAEYLDLGPLELKSHS